MCTLGGVWFSSLQYIALFSVCPAALQVPSSYQSNGNGHGDGKPASPGPTTSDAVPFRGRYDASREVAVRKLNFVLPWMVFLHGRIYVGAVAVCVVYEK